MILATDGAGTIGRHISCALGKAEVVALDDLRNPSRAALPPGVSLIEEEFSKARIDWVGVDAVVQTTELGRG